MNNKQEPTSNKVGTDLKGVRNTKLFSGLGRKLYLWFLAILIVPWQITGVQI